jgi:hypothetical protein
MTNRNGFALIEKTISQKYSGLKNLSFIAELTRLVQVVIWYEYLVKFSPLIFADHCSYQRSR